MLELNNLYNMDCMEGMAQFPDKYFDLAIVDPPYGIGFKYNSYEDTEDNLKYIINNHVPEIIRISERVLIFGNHQKIFLYPHPDWIYAYTWNTTGSYGKLGICQWQPILFYGKDIKGFGSINSVLKSDMTHISGGDGVGFRRMENINHPCPKPINITRRLIARFSNENDKIIDPYSGSATTPICCNELKRKWIAFEIDKDYYKSANSRIEIHKQQLRLF